MDNDNDNHNEASGSDGNNPGTDTAVSETDIQQPATTTTENFVKLKCRAFPHGVYSVGISFWSGFAWLICFSQDGCDYARVSGPSIADITSNPSTPFIDTGFSHYRAPVLLNGEWVIDMTTPCVEYNTEVVNIGAAAKFAQIASFVGSVLGGAGTIFVWFSLCLLIDRSRWRWVACEFLAASILQALSFTSFASSLCKTNNCSMENGARTAMLACIMWLVSALILFYHVPSVRVISSSVHQRSSQVDVPDRNSEAGNQAGVPELL